MFTNKIQVADLVVLIASVALKISRNHDNFGLKNSQTFWTRVMPPPMTFMWLALFEFNASDSEENLAATEETLLSTRLLPSKLSSFGVTGVL